MAAITRAFTLARVADLLGEDEDWLHEISIEMEPEDGILALYGLGEDSTPAFTDFGIESLRQLVQIHKDNAARMPASPSSKSPPRP